MFRSNSCKMLPRLVWCHDRQIGIPKLRPALSGKIGRYSFVLHQGINSLKGDTRHHARQCRNAQTPSSRAGVLEELFRKRIGKRDGFSQSRELPKYVSFFDIGPQICCGERTEMSPYFPGSIDTGEDCGLTRAALRKPFDSQRCVCGTKNRFRCRPRFVPTMRYFPQEGTQSRHRCPEHGIDGLILLSNSDTIKKKQEDVQSIVLLA